MGLTVDGDIRDVQGEAAIVYDLRLRMRRPRRSRIGNLMNRGNDLIPNVITNSS